MASRAGPAQRVWMIFTSSCPLQLCVEDDYLDYMKDEVAKSVEKPEGNVLWKPNEELLPAKCTFIPAGFTSSRQKFTVCATCRTCLSAFRRDQHRPCLHEEFAWAGHCWCYKAPGSDVWQVSTVVSLCTLWWPETPVLWMGPGCSRNAVPAQNKSCQSWAVLSTGTWIISGLLSGIQWYVGTTCALGLGSAFPFCSAEMSEHLVSLFILYCMCVLLLRRA